MALSRLPLGYCTNVHPGLSIVQVEEGLDRFTVPVRREYGGELAAGLWLADSVIREILAHPDGAVRFAEGLTRRLLTCHTLNAFPFGNFHAQRVKENVYLPDWADPRRLQYTLGCADVLAALLPAGVEGSISTLPLGFTGFDQPAGFENACRRQLIEAARGLERMRQETDKVIRLAIEPEPLCLLETTGQSIAFFGRLWEQAEAIGALEAVGTHLGLCYDVCHQAVEFEDVAASIRALDAAGVRINKVHVSCALELDAPMENGEGRAALKRYVEPRYLHQTTARVSDGRVARHVDLSEAFVNDPPPEFRSAATWRVHFHVPVDAERLGPLATTRSELPKALAAVAALDYAPHLEVETYTWEVLPDARPADLVAGLTRELLATREILASIH